MCTVFLFRKEKEAELGRMGLVYTMNLSQLAAKSKSLPGEQSHPEAEDEHLGFGRQTVPQGHKLVLSR